MPLRLPHSTHVVSGIVRLWHFALLGLVVLLILLVTGFGEESWRGARSWAACQRDLQARGETLDWTKFVPAPVPDERNLAMAPLFVRELRYGPDPKTGVYTFGLAAKFPPGELKDMPFAGPKPADIQPSGYETATHTDLTGYGYYYHHRKGFPHADQPQAPGAEVLLGLSHYAPALDQLALATAERPLTRFPVDWLKDDVLAIRLPHYYLQQKLVNTLRLRACARLASGDTENALRDLELAWRLCRDLPLEPSIISYLVECTCLRLTLNSVWESLADRRWSASQLVQLQDDLQRFDSLGNYLHAIRGERVCELRSIEFLKKQRDLTFLPSIEHPDNPPSDDVKMVARALGKITPPGWFDLNKVIVARWIQDYCVESVDVKTHRVFPEKPAAGALFLAAMSGSRLYALPRYMLPVLNNIERTAAWSQASLDEAVIACALERFFIDHQKYPEQLGELAPTYLQSIPTDPIGGAPLHYQPAPDGRFQLYSIGWNGRDDGGKVAWSASRQFEKLAGDWVWQYTEVHPPAPINHEKAMLRKSRSRSKGKTALSTSAE